jgi:hypothetical protein
VIFDNSDLSIPAAAKMPSVGKQSNLVEIPLEIHKRVGEKLRFESNAHGKIELAT